MQGVNVAEMVKAFERLKDEVISHDHDVSFAGDSTDIVFHAQRMLCDHLVKMNPEPDTAALL